ncbi:MAG: HlyD family efflux transporter periplasmic adaptor subunit [Legionella sp.]|nr:HlyD family efflux transporter periplasmic adaptor subunit [Legionella sp.]
MENKQSLFRAEAIQNRLNRSLGSTRINVPLNYKIVTLICILLVIIILLFLVFAEFSENIVVKGYLDSDKGIITIHSDHAGTILKSNLEEGQQVNKGDVLFIISNEEHEQIMKLVGNLKERIKNLKQEYHLKQDHYQSLMKLYNKQYVSASALKTVEAQLLEINNQIKSLDLEVMKYKHSLNQIIKSPVKGNITNILYTLNQTVNQFKPLLHIIPYDSKLIARLDVPVYEIGFLKNGKMVSIHYDAYPAQRFGVHKASIKEINLTVLTDSKEDKPINLGQPYYKVKAELERSYINVYGKKAALNYGMTFKGVIQGENKKIWQWIIDPIYSYYGDIF